MQNRLHEIPSPDVSEEVESDLIILVILAAEAWPLAMAARFGVA